MQRTRIKFCGITRSADAVAAADAGADAIGLVFYEKSRRCVSIDQARQIIAALPPFVSAVGLFVNAPVSEIIATTKILNLSSVQLHGDESFNCLPQLPHLKVIKAIHSTPEDLHTLSGWRSAAAILLDTANTAERGGSGVANDWNLVEGFLKDRENLPPLIAAGGLTPENVGSVVTRIRPWAVDVSSGIEESPGVKSIEKMRQFAEAVRCCGGS